MKEPPFSMPKEMRLGPPTFRVSDLDETLRFYESGFGLKVRRKFSETADALHTVELGFASAAEPLLVIKHDPKARPTRYDFAGLYHYAVLVPTRKSLASTYLAMGNSGVTFDGFADHSVSEALYLRDPEENGIEIYADRPKETWTRFYALSSGDRAADLKRLMSLNRPLDFNSLLRELHRDERNDPSRFPEGAKIGHMHLRVTDLERSVKFYHEVLGMDIVTNYPEIGAAFLAVGGYHHHLGLNVWNSRNGTPHEKGDAGLDHFTAFLPNRQTLEKIRSSVSGQPSSSSPIVQRNPETLMVTDPDGIEIEFRVER